MSGTATLTTEGKFMSGRATLTAVDKSPKNKALQSITFRSVDSEISAWTQLTQDASLAGSPRSGRPSSLPTSDSVGASDSVTSDAGPMPRSPTPPRGLKSTAEDSAEAATSNPQESAAGDMTDNSSDMSGIKVLGIIPASHRSRLGTSEDSASSWKGSLSLVGIGKQQSDGPRRSSRKSGCSSWATNASRSSALKKGTAYSGPAVQPLYGYLHTKFPRGCRGCWTSKWSQRFFVLADCKLQWWDTHRFLDRPGQLKAKLSAVHGVDISRFTAFEGKLQRGGVIDLMLAACKAEVDAVKPRLFSVRPWHGKWEEHAVHDKYRTFDPGQVFWFDVKNSEHSAIEWVQAINNFAEQAEMRREFDRGEKPSILDEDGTVSEAWEDNTISDSQRLESIKFVQNKMMRQRLLGDSLV